MYQEKMSVTNDNYTKCLNYHSFACLFNYQVSSVAQGSIVLLHSWMMWPIYASEYCFNLEDLQFQITFIPFIKYSSHNILNNVCIDLQFQINFIPFNK